MFRILDPYPQQFNYLSFYGSTPLSLDTSIPLKISKRIFARHVEFFNQVQSEMLLVKYVPLVANVALNVFLPKVWPIPASIILDYLYVKAVSHFAFPYYAAKVGLKSKVDMDPIFGFMLIKEPNIIRRKEYLDGMVAKENEINLLLQKNDGQKTSALHKTFAEFIPLRG